MRLHTTPLSYSKQSRDYSDGRVTSQEDHHLAGNDGHEEEVCAVWRRRKTKEEERCDNIIEFYRSVLN